MCLKQEVIRKDTRNSWLWSILGASNRCELRWNWDTRHSLSFFRQRTITKYMAIGFHVIRLFKNNWITLMVQMKKIPIINSKVDTQQWYFAILMPVTPNIFNIRVTGLTIMLIWELMYSYGIIEDSDSVKVIQALL